MTKRFCNRSNPEGVNPEGVMIDLLREFSDVRKSIPPEKQREFENFFIGALSNHCNPKVWRSALELAKNSF
jgi:hypothetical protein